MLTPKTANGQGNEITVFGFDHSSDFEMKVNASAAVGLCRIKEGRWMLGGQPIVCYVYVRVCACVHMYTFILHKCYLCFLLI